MLCVFPSKAPCWVVCRKFRQTTFSFKFVYTLSTHLYPHTHEGCDSMSIPCSSHQERFQSTHPRRVWPVISDCLSAHFLFQSTHPRRVWPPRFLLPVCITSFTPHTHEGCDKKNSIVFNFYVYVSIHTPTKGVTFWCKDRQNASFCFNPHTHEGCDWVRFPGGRQNKVSIHTPTKGVTANCTRYFAIGMFQSTHPRRVWRTPAYLI